MSFMVPSTKNTGTNSTDRSLCLGELTFWSPAFIETGPGGPEGHQGGSQLGSGFHSLLKCELTLGES